MNNPKVIEDFIERAQEISLKQENVRPVLIARLLLDVYYEGWDDRCTDLWEIEKAQIKFNIEEY